MKRKLIILSLSALLIAAIAAFSGTCLVLQAKDLQKEEKLRAANIKANITEAFHDQANKYMTPLEPSKNDEVTVRLRTEKYNVEKAQVQYTVDKGLTWQTADMSFEKHDGTGYYDLWVGKIPAQKSIYYYRFICANKTGSYFVDRNLSPNNLEEGDYMDCWAVSPGYHSADWAKGALWYNLVTDAFYNGDISGDTATSDYNLVNSWNHTRRNLSDKYGGDLKGISEKAEYLKDLYVDAVFMTPFNKAYQNVGYGPIYYNQVEPRYGNAQSLKDTLNVLHNSGFKVASDAVLTFTPQGSIYFDESSIYPFDGAAENENSPYKDMYTFYNWPNNYHLTWAGAALDHSSKTLQELLYTKSDSFLQYYTNQPFGFDSWRFDCGGWLYGRTDQGYLSDIDVLSVIKKNLQKINPEIFLVSETSGYNSMVSTVWDSHWNFSLARNGLRDYCLGDTQEGALSSQLKSSLNYPRPIALSIFNLLVTHDETRQHDYSAPAYMEKAGHLILMTYIGSPSIYYGEEVNLEREIEGGLGVDSSFYAMEWDESNWDYSRYNLYKSLGELRSKYSALKTGAIRELIVDNAQNIYSFGRWDDKGTVITVASQNSKTVRTDVKARLLDVADGTVFTDWLTGKQYEVDDDGMLHLDVIPGGSVFVSGKTASKYRDKYTVTQLKNSKSSIYLTDVDTYALEGKGELGKSDKITLASTNLYGSGSISAVASGNGEAALTVRQDASSKAAAYNVTVSENKLTVTARTKSGGKLQTVCETSYEKGNAVRINRDGKNKFSVSTGKLNGDGEISGKWTTVKGSETAVTMEYSAVAGFAPIKDSITLSNVTVKLNKEEIGSDDFESEYGTSMLSYSDAKKAEIKDGKLVLTAKNGITWANTGSKDNDWTFKAKLDSRADKEGNYAGVWSMADENQWIAAGRTVIDGKPVIFVGRTTDGTMQADTYVSDTSPDSSVIIQLQRIGSIYTVAYSYDGKTWSLIDDSFFANFSLENVGVFAAGKTDAAFDYVSFGDSINDGKSYNTPYSAGIVNVEYSDAVSALKMENTEILSGKWEYGAEGYNQTDKTGTAQLGFSQKCFADFKANVTLKLEDGDGYAAIGFGKSEHDTGENDGFLLKYTKDHKLTLIKNGVKMASATVKTMEDEKSLRVIAEVKNSCIKVYAGQSAVKVMDIANTGYSKGYVSFYSVNTAARFMNSSITSLSSTWSILTSNNDSRRSVFGGENTLVCAGSKSAYGAVSLLGVGVTDFVTSLEINRGTSTEAGILLCAYEGASKTSSGINLALDEEGNLLLRADGEEVARYAMGADTKKATVMAVKKNRVINVYVKGVSEPVMTYEDSYNRGGVYQLYSTAAESRFSGIGLEDIHNIGYEESTLWKLWKNGKLYSYTAETYKENFNSQTGWESLTKYHTDHGSWAIRDGALSCIDSPNWASGVTVFDRLFRDFSMEFKYRFDESSDNFAGVLFYKPRIDDTNNSAKYSLLLYSNGNIALFEAGSQNFVGQANVKNFEIGKWHQLRMVSVGNNIKVYDGDECLISYTSNELIGAEGFVSFTANRSLVSFDDVLIEPKK